MCREITTDFPNFAKEFDERMKKILLRLIRLLQLPQKEWQVIQDENAPIGVLRNTIVIPFMMCVIIAIVVKSILAYEPSFDETSAIETLLKKCSKELVICISSIFVGYHIAVLLISGPLTQKIFKYRPDYHATARLVAYIMAYYLIFKTITTLFPLFFFINIALIYLMYTIWYGIPILFPENQEEKHNKFTLYTFAIIFAAPFLMEKLMIFLMKL